MAFAAVDGPKVPPRPTVLPERCCVIIAVRILYQARDADALRRRPAPERHDEAAEPHAAGLPHERRVGQRPGFQAEQLADPVHAYAVPQGLAIDSQRAGQPVAVGIAQTGGQPLERLVRGLPRPRRNADRMWHGDGVLTKPA